jgi:hypothetical protein
MKKIFSFLLLFNLSTIGYSQVIKGTILDQNTNSIITFASVYFNGTFVGTHTDQNGYFELDVSRNLSMPLTISALGYYSVTLTDFTTNKPYRIYLAPKVYELKEVVITAKTYSIERKTNFNIFKKEFLGGTMNALFCHITNEDDIILTYNPVTDTLKAFSLNPILISNKALGYNLIYYLDKFEYCWSRAYVLIKGNCIFKEDSANNNSQQRKFERRRESAFLGSRMHFFRALWGNYLDSAGFTVRDSANAKMSIEKFIIQTDSIAGSGHLKYLKYNGTLFLAYHTKLPKSRIVMMKEYIFFDKDGFFDPLGIYWGGEMARQRIGDLLPLEYKLK